MSLNNITVPDDMISLKKGDGTNDAGNYVIWSNELLKNENNFLSNTEYKKLNYNFYLGENFPTSPNFGTYSHFYIQYINVLNTTNYPFGQIKLSVPAYFNYNVEISLPTPTNLYTQSQYLISGGSTLALIKSGNNYIFKKYVNSDNIQDTYFVLTMDGRWYSPTHKIYIIPTNYTRTDLYSFSYRISESNSSNDKWMITNSGFGINYVIFSEFGSNTSNTKYNPWRTPFNNVTQLFNDTTSLAGGLLQYAFISYCSQHDTANDLPMFLSERFPNCKNAYNSNILIDSGTTTILDALQNRYVEKYPLYQNSVSYCNSLTKLNQTNCFNYITSECKDYMLEYGPCKNYCKIKPDKCKTNLTDHCSKLITQGNFFDETRTDQKSLLRRNLCGCNMNTAFYNQIFDAYNSTKPTNEQITVRPECYFKDCVSSDYKPISNIACPPYQICLSKIEVDTSGIVDKSKINIRGFKVFKNSINICFK